MTTWECSACNATVEYDPAHDGDMPANWFRLENRALLWVLCSLACVQMTINRELAATVQTEQEPT